MVSSWSPYPENWMARGPPSAHGAKTHGRSRDAPGFALQRTLLGFPKVISHLETSKSIKIADCLQMACASVKGKVSKQGMLEYKF